VVALGRQRTPLTRQRVLAAAVELADAQGIDALTLRRLAQALNVHPTSIYHHVPSKEAILDGLAEVLIAEAALPADFQTWQEWIRGFAAALRALAKAHPGAFATFTRRPARGPAADDQLEAALAAFRRDGFSAVTANEAVAATTLAVIGLTTTETAIFGTPADPGTAHLQPERYPHIAEAVRAAPANTDGMWNLLVESLIAGLESAAVTTAIT
jgi:AcrR family transcriptional regulator